MDEETFKACNEAFYRKMSEKHRAFENWHLSNCCLQIGKSIDVLNKDLKKKPFYGMMLMFHQKSSFEDSRSNYLYELEKKELNKKLQNVTVTGRQGHDSGPAKDTIDGHMLS